jgi:hypothetical protein
MGLNGRRCIARAGTPGAAALQAARWVPPRRGPFFTRESCYWLEASSSSPTTCSTSAARTVSSIDASFTKPACNPSSSRSDIESRSTPGVASVGRTLCSQRSRISAARGSETARSRKPLSISASEGGSPLRRVARGSRAPRDARARGGTGGRVTRPFWLNHEVEAVGSDHPYARV